MAATETEKALVDVLFGLIFLLALVAAACLAHVAYRTSVLLARRRRRRR